jgi:hypothetical protein
LAIWLSSQSITLEFVSVLPFPAPKTKYRVRGGSISDVAIIVKQKKEARVIRENWLNLVSLSYQTKVEATYLLLKTPEQFQKAILPEHSYSLFFLAPSPNLKKMVREAGFQLQKT